MLLSCCVYINHCHLYSCLCQHHLALLNLRLPLLVKILLGIQTGLVHNHLSDAALNDGPGAVCAGPVCDCYGATITADAIAAASIDHIAFSMFKIPVLEWFLQTVWSGVIQATWDAIVAKSPGVPVLVKDHSPHLHLIFAPAGHFMRQS